MANYNMHVEKWIHLLKLPPEVVSIAKEGTMSWSVDSRAGMNKVCNYLDYVYIYICVCVCVCDQILQNRSKLHVRQNQTNTTSG